MRRSKLYKKQVEVEGFDPQQRYGVAEAIALLKKFPGVKFDQTAEVAFKLGVDPRKSDQTVRGAVALPAGTGKSVRVAVVADGAAAAEAKEAGADFVGFEDVVEKIKSGWQDFDILIATPDAMRLVRPLGRQLGPRGLIPIRSAMRSARRKPVVRNSGPIAAPVSMFRSANCLSTKMRSRATLT